MEKHILITGGSGFIGRHICSKAASMNIPVVSISRSGKPSGFYCDNDPLIKWVKADVFKPESWNEYLTDCRAVIHCVAILFQRSSKNITHNRFIYQSACIVGDETIKSEVPKFVFISAALIPFFMLRSYNHSKRKAEEYLSTLKFNLAILKPGLVYGDEKPIIRKLSLVFNFFAKIPGLRYVLPPLFPLSVETISEAAVIAATKQSIQGILNTDEIKKIAKSS
jgi:nucleoside-diphosphate-sugar epimerase